MPVVNLPIEPLLRLVNTGGRTILRESDVSQTLHDMGVEVDEITSTNLFECRVCNNVLDRTDAQGPPLTCPKCGADFREKSAHLRTLGVNKVARLDMVAVRPDIFDVGGMSRYMRGFLGVQLGLIEYPVAAPRLSLVVDPRLARDESYRPAIACAVMRNVHLDNERIKLLMTLQEDLHWALGRDRKLASIGVYDLDRVSTAKPFRYQAIAPDGVRFVPLGFSLDDPAAALAPREILQRHKTGQAYAHLLATLSDYPLLTDGAGLVLSMPPIINSEATRVTLGTRQCFVDVTGLAQRTVERALNILLSGMKEVCPEIELEAVTIDGPDGRRVTPDFSPLRMELDVQRAADTIGVDLSPAQLKELLERMGHGVELKSGALQVRVPAWRNDVLHAVDLIEDAAIAYGYDKLVPALVPTFTVGRPREIEEQSGQVRRVFTGLGFHEVMTLNLSSEPAAFEKWGLPPDPRAVRIANPISSEQTICRVSLLPGLLETLAINKQYDLPQQLFEIGDCSFVDAAAETGAREERFLAAVMIGPHAGYADVRAVIDAFAHEMMIGLTIEPLDHPSLIAGRSAALLNSRGEKLGLLGELHPHVLEQYNLRHAVALLELNLTVALS